MKKTILNEEKQIFHDVKTGKDYLFSDGAFIELKAPERKKQIELGNSRPINDSPKFADFLDKRKKQIEKEEEEYGSLSFNDEEKIKTRWNEIQMDMDSDDYDVTKDNDDIINKANAKEARRLERDERRRKEREAAQAEINRYKLDRNNMGTADKFKMDLNRLIKSQVGKARHKEKSWSRFNNKYEGTGIIKPGVEKKKNDIVPSVFVYYDQSASWNDREIKAGNAMLTQIKKDYVDKGLLNLEIYYWADEVTTYPPHNPWGTDAQPVIEHIYHHAPDNVIVFTDSDTNNQDLSKVKVKGGVFFLFKNGRVSNAMFEAILGSPHRAYSFYA